MSGLYIHLPFCASRCIYCGFYSTTLPTLQTRYTDALCREMDLRRHYLDGCGHALQTIYLGGGTPSQLSLDNLSRLFLYINKEYPYLTHVQEMEITMECNPDDLTPTYVEGLRKLPVNRISLGIQTFSDSRLQLLHRRHTAQEAKEAVSRLQQAGFRNISIDLMFGFPEETVEEWHEDVWTAIELGVNHISAYSLMYEEGTALWKMRQEGKIKETDEEVSLAMYNLLMKEMSAAGFEHYEISNFALPGFRSRHNSSYWHQIPYIGIGATAHSFDIKSRQWNIADIMRYMTSIEGGTIPCEREEIDARTRYNDLVTTALRTSEGLELKQLPPLYHDYLLKTAKPWIVDRKMEVKNGRARITRGGIFVSDDIMSDLMYV